MAKRGQKSSARADKASKTNAEQAAMTTYEFFVSNGAPKPADKAVRSHAMRTALQLRGRGGGGAHADQPPQGSVESQRTEELRDGLKGRFRLGIDHTSHAKATNVAGREANDKSASKKQKKKVRRYHQQKQHVQALLAGQSGTHSTPLGAAEAAAMVMVVAGEGTGGVQWFGSGPVDPFGQMPADSNWRVDMLVKYFLTRFSLNISTVDKQRPWFSYAMSHPVIMHATLALSAVFWGAATCQTSKVIRREGIYQKGEAIKCINGELMQSIVSNELVAGVASLANIAAIEGHFIEADVHVRGLQRLIQLRGGVDTFKDVFYLARSITWTDVQVASALARRPLLQLIHGLEEVDLPESLLKEAETPPLAHLDGLGDSGGTIRSVLLYFRQAVLCREYRIAVPNGIRILLNVAELQILNHIGDKAATAEEQRFKTLLLATHVFLYAGLRQLPIMGPMVKLLVARLREALEAGEVNAEAFKHNLYDLLWVLFVGAAASSFPNHQDTAKSESPSISDDSSCDSDSSSCFFSSRLELVLRLLRVDSQAALRTALQRYVWADEFGRDFLARWWIEIHAEGRDERLPRLLSGLDV